MQKKRFLAIGLAAVMVCVYVGVSFGSSGYLTSFNALYGTAGTALNSCTLCHTSVPSRNPYGAAFGSAGHNFAAIESLDSDGDGHTNIAEINARTFPGNAASLPAPAADAIPPVVTAFAVPATAASLIVSVSSFTATDNVAVTGYMITETSAAPAAAAPGWAATPPSTYTFATQGAKTVYAWAKDAAGNVSAAVSAPTTIAVADAIAPTISAFVVPASSTSLIVPVTTFSATDNIGVTGYLITESTVTPSPAPEAGWTAAAPTTYTFAMQGAKTVYAWAKDAAGNISASRTSSTTIALADTSPPSVTSFVIPATAASLTVEVTAFTATDSTGVTGYLITESTVTPSPAPEAGWTATAPTTYTFASEGAKTVYAWAKDEAGNVSASFSAAVSISQPPAGQQSTIADAGTVGEAGGPAPITVSRGGSGGCFIATAAFGSYLDPYVRILRTFRDIFLLSNSTGKAFVNWYYRTSPPVAQTIARHDWLRSVVRAVLMPLVGFGLLALQLGLIPALVVVLLAVTALCLLARKAYLLSRSCGA